MQVIGIVAEYNPFHNGHLYQINEIRRVFPDCAVIAVMSGSLTQRGEPAFTAKEFRAKAAVMCGVDLVLELPSPFSSASAEIFARSAVYILHALGVCDYLCFGSENGNVGAISDVAEKLLSNEFENALSQNIKINKNLSYHKIINKTYGEIFGVESLSLLNGSNNILALEYLKTLKKLHSDIIPFTVKRTGDDYNSLNGGEIASATFIRKFVRKNGALEIDKYIPSATSDFFAEKISNAELFDAEIFGIMALSYIKRLSAEEIGQYPEISGGFEYKIKEAAERARSFEELCDFLAMKIYSKSRIRRALLYIFFDIKKDALKELPQFTNFLAATKKGLEILSAVRKKSAVKIITKQYGFVESEKNLLAEQQKKSVFIDNVCELTMKNKTSLIEAKKKPFILKT